jgi:hypothetical protein
VEGSLDLVEGKDRPVSSSSLSTMNRESNGIVERETKGRVSLFAALSTIEELILEKVDDGEESYMAWFNIILARFQA